MFLISKLRSSSDILTRDERGVTLVEYGIAVALAVAVGTVGLIALATEINSQIRFAENHML